MADARDEPLREAAPAHNPTGAAGSGSSASLEAAARAPLDPDALRTPAAQRLRLGETLGVGGMGEVVAARDAALGRPLAVKRVLGSEGLDDDAVESLSQRLIDEAQITAQLDHPGVVPVHDLGVDEAGRPFFTMKRVHGHTLSEVFRRERSGERTSLPRTLQVFVRLCETLSYAHRKGVVHRDVKPANVMVGRFGEVYLMDWGLAKLRGDPSAVRRTPGAAHAAEATEVVRTHRSERRRGGSDEALTMDDQIVGTLGYLAPEQLVGAEVDERADVYAVGAMLYELLAGHAPYREPGAGDDLGPLLVRMVREEPAALVARAPDAPPELAAIATKALARDPARRYATAADLAEDLHAYLEGRVVRAHRTGLWIEWRKWVARNRWLAAGLLAAGLAAASAVVAFVAQQRRAAEEIGRERDRARDAAEAARAEGRRAEGLRLAAQSRLLPDDPGLALALAVEATRRAPGPAAASAVYDALRRHREERCFFGHEAYVVASAWTSDGTRVISGDEHGCVVVWDVERDAPTHWLDGPTEPVRAIVVEPGDRHLAVLHVGGPVRVWDLGTGRETQRLDVDATSAVAAGAGRWALATSHGDVLRWEPGSSATTSLWRAEGPVHLATGLASGAARVVVTGPGRVAIVPVDGGPPVEIVGPDGAAEPTATVCEAVGEVMVRWRPDEVVVYDLADGARRRRVAEGRTVTAIAYATDGSRIAVGSQARGGLAEVEVTERRDGALVARVELDPAVALRLTRDGKGLVAVDRSHAVYVELDAGVRSVPLRGHRYTIAHAALAPDEARLATASNDATLRVWTLRPAHERRGLVARAAAGHRVLGWSQDASRALVVVSRQDGGCTLEVVDASTGRVTGRFESPSTVWHGGLDDTGGAAWWCEGRGLRLGDVATGAVQRAADLPERVDRPDAGLWPSPDGRHVLVDLGEALGVYVAATGREVGRVAVGRAPMRPQWAPDGAHLIIAHPPAARSARYALDGVEPLKEYVGHTGWVTDARVDATGRWVVSVAADTTVRVFHVDTGQTVGLFRGLPMRGARLAMGPRGDRVGVMSSKLVLLRLFDDGRLAEEATLGREGAELLGYHPDGARFWLRHDDQRVSVFGLDAGAEGRRWMSRPVLPVDGVVDYVPDPTDPLDAAWLDRPDAWWRLERAERSLVRGDLDDAASALEAAERARPGWASAALLRVRLAAAKATAAGAPADATVRELVAGLDVARQRGGWRVIPRRWNVTPREVEPYANDPRIVEALARLRAVPR